ncbi:MAG: hypothetical protein ABFR33_06965 [Verrucomicrobiota bacterium]
MEVSDDEYATGDEFENQKALSSYCPFCDFVPFSLVLNTTNRYHATTTCCGTNLYGRAEDFPPDYTLAPSTNLQFQHLDGTVADVPCTIYTDSGGRVWELFIKTLFDQLRWLEMAELVDEFNTEFIETANPLYPYKTAIILDEVADTYYGLPLSYFNALAKGTNGNPLTRGEWDAVPRPNIFDSSYLGVWNRRKPAFNKGWLTQAEEGIWAEPFARMRHHPAFKHYSTMKYGDPDAISHKVETNLLQEIVMMHESVSAQKLITNYQDANYSSMLLLGILSQDSDLIDFAAPNHEAVLYNHHYHDGMNGEGAHNYMEMLSAAARGYYPYLQDPDGWLHLYPDFLTDHPFFDFASTEWEKLTTTRGLPLEFGDQHIYTANVSGKFLTDTNEVMVNAMKPSGNWPGYGVGLLRVGDPSHRMELSLVYGRALLHGSIDPLGTTCWFDGIPIIRPGGYAAISLNIPLDFSKPEISALNDMGYPSVIDQAENSMQGWGWYWAHGPQAQNTVTVNKQGTGRGWQDNCGTTELIAYKGGEQTGGLPARFQVLEARSIKAFDRIGVNGVEDFRRALIAVEGPLGRPYAVDILKLDGGDSQEHYQAIWGSRVSSDLPAVAASHESLGTAWSITEPYDHVSANYMQITNVQETVPVQVPWSVSWETDYADYYERDPFGGEYERPFPENVGHVFSRMTGLPHGNGESTLWSGKAPWIARIKQLLENYSILYGNVGFMTSMDMIIEQREPDQGQPLESRFVRVLEGWHSEESPVVETISEIETADPTVLVLQVDMTNDFQDIIVFQEGNEAVSLGNGLSTDARYALLRTDGQSEVIEAHMVGGTYLNQGGFALNSQVAYTGTITDIDGDITGTRQESALIIQPDNSWPSGDILAGRELIIHTTRTNEINEAYTITGTTSLPGDLLRVDLDGYSPFVAGWHQVALLDGNKLNRLRTNRPMQAFINQPWYEGAKVWFPTRDKTYVIKDTEKGDGALEDTYLEVADGVDLAADGIVSGDWFVIYAIEPGQTVSVLGAAAWSDDYTLTYTAGANGSIGGMSLQLVDYGEDGTAVTAEPDANYVFVDWSDSRTDNPRIDLGITNDLTVTATFAPHPSTVPNIIPYEETFELYTNGLAVFGAVDGWSASSAASALVTTHSALISSLEAYEEACGYPVPSANHGKVLEVNGTVDNLFDMATGQVLWVDNMVLPYYESLTTDPNVLEGVQAAVGFNLDGHPAVWHYDQAGESNRWTVADDVAIPAGEWVRLTYTLDYQTKDLENSVRYFQIRLNGILLTNALAWTSNDGTGNPGGSWFSMSFEPDQMHYFTCRAEETALDDLLVTTTNPLARDVAIASAHGQADPAVGTHAYTYSDNIALSLTNGTVVQGINQFVYTGWDMSGHAPASGSGTNVQITLTNDLIITWHWTTNNALTADGTPIWWLTSHGLGDDLGDTDNDDMLAWQEWVCDTDPTNKDSVLKLTDIEPSGADMQVCWQGGVLATQLLERCSNLVSSSWAPLLTNVPPTSVTNNHSDSSITNPAGFYRIKAWR